MEYLIIEDDSFTIISWIQEAMRTEMRHPLLRNIAVLLQDCTEIVIHHVYFETNSVADWAAFYMVNHYVNIVWTDLKISWFSFGIFFFPTFLDVFILDWYTVNLLAYQKKKVSFCF